MENKWKERGKIMAKNYDQMASKIIEKLGGKDNIAVLNHCATRLRVDVNDASAVDTAALEKVNGVLGVELKGNQLQVIIGQTIEDVFQAVTKQVGNVAKTSSAPKGNQTLLQRFAGFLMMMGGIMSPIIPALIASGLINVTLLILQWLGVDTTSTTYVMLNGLAQAVFYFMPIYVAYSAANKFGTEPVLAMVLAAWLLYPDWVAMAAEGGFTSYFGIPTLLTTYNGSVLQIIIAVFVMSKLDTWLKRVLPESVRHFLKPFILLILMSIITLPIIAPLGGLITDYIYAFVQGVRNVAPWAAVPAIILLSLTLGVFMPGWHMALVPIALASIADVGYDDLVNIWFYACTITPAFMALWVAIKTKNNNLKQIAFPASLSAFFGISEPTTYGITYKMPSLYGVFAASSLITGIYAGIVHLKCYGFGGYALTNILLFLGPNGDTPNFIKALIGVGIMAVVTFIGVNLVKWDDSIYSDEDEDENDNPVTDGIVSGTATLIAPVEGEFVAQENINDSLIAQGALGKCFGIKPSDGTIKAPISGTINSVAPTKHAITIYGNHGEQVMVHIGLDSVNMNGAGLQTFVKAGMKVKAGERIASYSKGMFDNSGIDDTVVTFLLNSDAYQNVTINKDDKNAVLVAEV